MAASSTPSTVWDCLETPGIAVTRFGPNATSGVEIDTLSVGLLASVDVDKRPTHVFYDADFLDHLYDLVKQDLHQQHPSLANLPATSRLITKMNLKGDDLPRMWHTAEGDCVLMDCMDLVWPTLEAVSAIQAGIGQPRHLEGAASTVNPLIDLAIYEIDTVTDIPVGPRLVVFEHKSVSVAKALLDFDMCTQFATPNARLDYAGARSGLNKANTVLVEVRRSIKTPWVYAYRRSWAFAWQETRPDSGFCRTTNTLCSASF
jgi:hypothetical protein